MTHLYINYLRAIRDPCIHSQNKTKMCENTKETKVDSFENLSPKYSFGNSRSILSLPPQSLVLPPPRFIWEKNTILVLSALGNYLHYINYIMATQHFVRWPRNLTAISSKQLIHSWKLHTCWLKKESLMGMREREIWLPVLPRQPNWPRQSLG